MPQFVQLGIIFLFEAHTHTHTHRCLPSKQNNKLATLICIVRHLPGFAFCLLYQFSFVQRTGSILSSFIVFFHFDRQMTGANVCLCVCVCVSLCVRMTPPRQYRALIHAPTLLTPLDPTPMDFIYSNSLLIIRCIRCY